MWWFLLSHTHKKPVCNNIHSLFFLQKKWRWCGQKCRENYLAKPWTKVLAVTNKSKWPHLSARPVQITAAFICISTVDNYRTILNLPFFIWVFYHCECFIQDSSTAYLFLFCIFLQMSNFVSAKCGTSDLFSNVEGTTDGCAICTIINIFGKWQRKKKTNIMFIYNIKQWWNTGRRLKHLDALGSLSEELVELAKPNQIWQLSIRSQLYLLVFTPLLLTFKLPLLTVSTFLSLAERLMRYVMCLSNIFNVIWGGEGHTLLVLGSQISHLSWYHLQVSVSKTETKQTSNSVKVE